jgi:hypothetical protein
LGKDFGRDAFRREGLPGERLDAAAARDVTFGIKSPYRCPDQIASLSFVMPAHSASEDARERAYVAGIHVFCASNEDVDGRDKPGHDPVCASI